jgi:hypothetical protein
MAYASVRAKANQPENVELVRSFGRRTVLRPCGSGPSRIVCGVRLASRRACGTGLEQIPLLVFLGPRAILRPRERSEMAIDIRGKNINRG